MGGGRQAPAKPNPAKKKPSEWRIRGWRVRNLVAGGFLLAFFAIGFYIAQLYGEISTLIEQRRAALTSAIFSAPFPIRAGDDLDHSGLLDRLAQLSYSQVPSANTPGEYTSAKNAIAIYLRSFYVGAQKYPAELVRVGLDGKRITLVADSFGVPKTDVMLEPEVIGRLFPGAPAERVEVQLGDLKPYLVKGLLANEDRYFYYHFGFDPIRIIEAAIVDLHSHHLRQGASTLTQQLVKNYFLSDEQSFGRKATEAVMALRLEAHYSKEEILVAYLNEVYLGQDGARAIHGFGLASEYYFAKPLAELDVDEMALLIGLVKGPSFYDPRKHPERARARRNLVLQELADAHVIDPAAAKRAAANPLALKPPGGSYVPAYLDLVRRGVGSTPPLFLDQLVHVILRNVLDGCQDPFVLRAAELLFRPQRMTVHEGSLIAADAETIAGSRAVPLSPLVSMLGIPSGAEIDVLVDDNASTYWARSDLFDMAIDLTAGRRGLAALGEVMSRWVRHMLSVEVNIEPLTEMRDVEFTWYVGLDAAATRIGNALWNGDALDDKIRSSLVGLYRLRFSGAAGTAETIKGAPVHLILAMTPDKVLRMKPQNLLTGLPVRRLEAAS